MLLNSYFSYSDPEIRDKSGKAVRDYAEILVKIMENPAFQEEVKVKSDIKKNK